MLEIRDLTASYGAGIILHEISLAVERGEVVGLLGLNGAGKTTTIRSIMGQTTIHTGSIQFDDIELSRVPCQKIPRMGIAVVPQGNRVFPNLTVRENFLVASHQARNPEQTNDSILDFFPQLAAKADQNAGTLSGGEQQMLALARVWLLDSKLVLLDEPTEGLMPSLVHEVENQIMKMRDQKIGVLIAEQRLDIIRRVCDRVVVLQDGRVVIEGKTEDLDEKLMKEWLGFHQS